MIFVAVKHLASLQSRYRLRAGVSRLCRARVSRPGEQLLRVRVRVLCRCVAGDPVYERGRRASLIAATDTVMPLPRIQIRRASTIAAEGEAARTRVCAVCAVCAACRPPVFGVR